MHVSVCMSVPSVSYMYQKQEIQVLKLTKRNQSTFATTEDKQRGGFKRR